jgi:hypothetical protein
MTEQNIFAGIFNVSFEGALAQLVDSKVAAAIAAKQDGALTDADAVKAIVDKVIADYSEAFMETTVGDEVKEAIKDAVSNGVDDAVQEALDDYNPTGHYDFDSSVDSRISDYMRDEGYIKEDELEDKVSDAVGEHDFSDAIDSAIDDYDMSEKVKLAIDEGGVLQDAVIDAVKAYMEGDAFADKLQAKVIEVLRKLAQTL